MIVKDLHYLDLEAKLSKRSTRVDTFITHISVIIVIGKGEIRAVENSMKDKPWTLNSLKEEKLRTMDQSHKMVLKNLEEAYYIIDCFFTLSVENKEEK